MANVGAGEVLKAYLVKESIAKTIDSQIKTLVENESIKNLKGVRMFKFRYLTDTEMTFQPISGWLKGKIDRAIFTSERNIKFDERDLVVFDDGVTLRVTRSLPQKQHGMFLVSGNFPQIVELQ